MSRKTLLFWLLFPIDILLLYASLFLAIRTRYPEGLSSEQFGNHIQAFTILIVIWLVVYFIHGLFESGSLRRYTTLIFNLVSATIVNLVLAIAYFYFQPGFILTPRRFLLLVVGFSFILVCLWHLIIKVLIRGQMVQGVYLFSFNSELRELEREINAHAYFGMKVLGHLDEQSLLSSKFSPDALIVVPDNLQSRPEVLRRLYDLRTQGVAFSNHRDFYEQLLRRVHVLELNEVWFLENIDYREKRFYGIVKRLVDILSGLFAGIVFAITWPVCALLIKLTSPGPVLFIQERVGRGGEPFRVYKYRTMSQGSATNTWTSVNDPRITRVGKFLRKSRLDELPQFINLLAGNMSLVGPRPEQSHIVEQLKKDIPFYGERHLVKPGLTGWAQLNIYAGSLEESKVKLQYDLYYVKHRSFLFDLEIILKTIYYIFTWQGR